MNNPSGALTIISSVTILLAGCSPHRPDVVETSTLDSARVLSSGLGRPILIDFYAQPCPPCKAFDRALADDERLQSALTDVVLIRLDVDTAEGKELSAHHLVQVTPTYLLLNRESEVIGKWVGYDGPEAWARQLSTLLADPVTVPERAARFSKEPTFEDALALGNLAGSHREAYTYYRRAASLDPHSSREADVPILAFRSAFSGVATQEFTPEEVGVVIDDLVRSEDVKPEYIIEIAERLIGVVQYVGIDVVGPYLDAIRPEVLALERVDLQVRRDRFLSRYAAMANSNAEKTPKGAD